MIEAVDGGKCTYLTSRARMTVKQTERRMWYLYVCVVVQTNTKSAHRRYFYIISGARIDLSKMAKAE
jgi:hypothetical protein